MKLSKRMLAVLCTLLMLASCFALPYGALAAEDTSAETSTDIGKVVSVIQADESTTTVNGSDYLGKQYNNLSIALDKPAASYVIMFELKIHQEYGFTDAEWMEKSLTDGGIQVTSADGTSKGLGNLLTNLPKSVRVNDEWMQLYVPMVGFTGTDINKLHLNFYNHPERYDSNLTADDRLTGASASYRNVQIVDMSRKADGSLSNAVIMFGQPGLEITETTIRGNHTTTNIPTTKAFYNLATSDMDLSKLTLEFDMMYTSDDAEFDPYQIKNGRIRFGSGQGESTGTWSNEKLPLSDTWYHLSVPLSGFNASLTDPSKIENVYAFNYNDVQVDGTQTNPGFTTHVKNIVITHSDVIALEDALEDAKNYIYDVDAYATAYENELEAARAVLADEKYSYADCAAALSKLNDALANLTNAEYHGKEVVATLSQMPEDWRNIDGVTNNDTGITLVGNLSDYHLQLKVETVSGDPLSSVYTGNLHLIELRNNNGGENVYGWNVNFSQIEGGNTNSTIVSIPLTGVNASGVQVAPGITINRANLNGTGTKETILSYITQARVPSWKNNMDQKLKISDVKIVDTLPDRLDAELEGHANATLPAGKYTAASAKAYLDYRQEAQAMLENEDATLQAKNQLIKAINAAKANLEAVVSEYLQFGEPETVYSYTNNGISHNQEYTFNLANKKTLPADCSNLVLRLEVKVVRDDGNGDISTAFVNREMLIRTTVGDSSVELQANLTTDGSWTNTLMGSRSAGEWHTIIYPLSSFGIGNKTGDKIPADQLADYINGMTAVQPRGYNDTKQGITIEFRNIAIVDNTNAAKVEELKALFTDVTKGGTLEFTPDSYAAYKAVYDNWYSKVYETVDWEQYDDAKAALDEAYKGLVCVEPTVMTFSQFVEGNHINTKQMYADWRGADQGMVDISTHKIENLRIRFEYSFVKVNPDAADIPDVLTIGNRRMALRKWRDTEDKEHGCTFHENGNEHSIEETDRNNFLVNVKGNEVNYMDHPLSEMSINTNNVTDFILRDIIFWMDVEEFADSTNGDYKMVINNARLVDVTKENMLADLKAKAETSLEDMGIADGVVYDEASATDLFAAQEAAKPVLEKEDPTYAELDEALKAIDAAKASLKLIGHTLVAFDNWNRTIYNGRNWNDTGDLGGPNQFYNEWGSTSQGATDLTQYNEDNLRLRFNVYFGLSGKNAEQTLPETLTNRYFRLAIRSANKKAGYEDKEAARNLISSGAIGGTTLTWGNNVIDIALKDLNTDDYLNLDSVKDIIFWLQIPELAELGVGDFVMIVDNARIVDTTVEKNLGTVATVGNGMVEIAGGLTYGKSDVLTATTTSDTSNFVGWRVNDTFYTADELANVKVTGSENITAYFVDDDETAVIYYGKYSRVVDVKVVKDLNKLTAPAHPAIVGWTSLGWDEVVALNPGSTVSVMANYVVDNTNNYTVTLENTTNDAVLTGKHFDERVDVIARDALDGEVFSHWTINGNVAGYEKELTFYVSGDMTVKAEFVAAGEEVDPALSASINRIWATQVDDKYTISVIGQTYVPEEGYELMEYGVYFATSEDTLNDLENAATGKYLKVVSSSRISNRQYQINLTKVTAGKARCAMAYVTAYNVETGEVETVYSAVKTQVAE